MLKMSKKIIAKTYNELLMLAKWWDFQEIEVSFELKESEYSIFSLLNPVNNNFKIIFKETQKIYNIENHQELFSIIDCIFEKDLVLTSNTFIWQFAIIRSEIKWSLSITSCNFMSDCFLYIKWSIWHIDISNVIFKKNLTISWKDMFFDRFTFWVVHIYDENKWFLNFDKLKWNILTFTSFHNSSTNLSLTSSVLELLEVINSDLWEIKFNGAIVNNLKLENATLNNCIFNWVDFPDDYKLEEIKDEDGKIDFKKMKDNYRQLKFVMDKNGNHTEANKFYAKEMEYYEKTLGIMQKWFWGTLIDIFNPIWWWWENKKRWEKLALIFSNLITEHWTNLIRWIFVLLMFVLLSTVISLLYLITWLAFCNSPLNYFASECTSIETLNIISVWIILLIITSLVKSIVKYPEKNQDKEKEYIWSKWDYRFLSLLVFMILLVSLLWWIKYVVEGQNYSFIPFKHFINLLDPTYWLVKNQISNYTTIEITFFVMYKIFYWIILWHVLVAARRTTRR